MRSAVATWRKRFWVAFAAVLMVSSVSTRAQNGMANSNRAQAALHIQVVVIPTVFSGAASVDNHHRDFSLSYHLPSISLQLETSVQEIDPHPTQYPAACGPRPCNGVIRTTTVVAR